MADDNMFCRKVKIKQNAPNYSEKLFKKSHLYTFWRNSYLNIKFFQKCNSAKYVT